MEQKKSPQITESFSKRGKNISKICIHTDMIFSIMVLGRHLVMYWAPENENKSFKQALEVLKKWKKVFFFPKVVLNFFSYLISRM